MTLTGDWFELLIGMLFGTLVLLLAATPAPAGQFDKEIHEMVFRDDTLFREKLRSAMERYVDNPESVSVSLTPHDKGKMLAGHFKEIRIEMKEALVKNLLIEKAIIHLYDPVVDYEALLARRKFRFKHQGRAECLLVVQEKALNDLFHIKRKKLKVRNPRIDFRRGHIRFSGSIRTLFCNQKVRVAGVLVPKPGGQVHFHPRWLNIGILPIPRFILRTVARRVNPIATFDAFSFDLSLGAIETTDDRIYISSAGFHEEALLLAKSHKASSVD